MVSRSLDTSKLARKKVLIRGDLDVEDADNPRTESVRKLVAQLISLPVAQLKVIGHRETEFPICDVLRKEFPEVEFDDGLRVDPGEKANDLEFAKKLADGWDVYINEAFATSHRKHASIDALPRIMNEKYMGPRFEKELEMLDKISLNLKSTSMKAVLVIGGTKVEDKQRFAEGMGEKFGAVLRGGLLPGTPLRPDGLDISDEAILNYTKVISESEMILAAGVMGKYEDDNSSRGTREVLLAIANNTSAYKVAGGGDIETAIGKYGLSGKFDWISVGGGAMLEYLASGTLVGLEALK